MMSRRAAWLAWSVSVLVVGLALAGVALTLNTPGTAQDPWSVANNVLGAVFDIAFGVVGALIFARQPRNTIGWLLMVIGVAFGLITILPGTLGQAVTPSAAPSVPAVLISWISGWDWWLLMGPLLLILLLFPTGRLPSPRWRWVVALLGVCFAVFLSVGSLDTVFPTPDGTGYLRNPLGLIPDETVQALVTPFEVLLATTVLLCTAAIFVRYRRAGRVEREQIKWFLYACALFLLAFVAGFGLRSFKENIGGVVSALATLGIPLSIGVAILRHRLWDIDVIIRRTLVYSVLTALLVLIYFGSVLVAQSVVRGLTGQSQSPLVTVVSTLLIAALFGPLRHLVQSAIDRRFYRRKYDAARTLSAFSAALRDETDLDQLAAHLTDVVDEAMQPEQVGLWLKTGPGQPAGRMGLTHE